jgi:predicted nucleic acid-binding protein
MMADIVCNTGPLIALERIEHLALLEAVFGHVVIPTVVEREFLAGEPAGSSFFEAKAGGWIQVSALEIAPDPLLSRLLDDGEAAVIQLARALSIGQVLIDERKGRKVARQIYGLRTLGTERVLLEAKQCGLIDSVQRPLALMREQGYHIHDDIVRFALSQAGEELTTP